MKKKKVEKKLALNQETLRTLAGADLERVLGAFPTTEECHSNVC